MAAVSQKILNWLYSVLTSEYQDVNRTYGDVAQVLSSYSSLSPRTEVYTYENGSSALLLQLSGTIPVSFRGSTYRFPVIVWIPYAYPKEPPMIYVVPTQGMIVRPGQHISGEGRVYHPYLANWERFWDRSNLQDFFAILREVFSKEPPVVSQSSDSRPSQQTQSPPPVPPLPRELEQSLPHAPQLNRDSYTSQQPPPPPPKPYSAHHSIDSSSQPYSEQTYQSLPPGPIAGQQLNQPGYQALFDPNLSRPTVRYGNTRPQDLTSLPISPAFKDFSNTDLRAPAFNSSNVVLSENDSYGTFPAFNTASRDPKSYSPVSPVLPQGVQQGYREEWQQENPPFPPSRSQNAYSIPQVNQRMGSYDYQAQQGNPQPSTQMPTKSRPAPKNIPNLLDTPADLILQQPSNLPVPPVPPNPEKDQLLHSLGVALFQQRQASDAKTKSSLDLLEAQYNALSNAASRLQEETEALEGISASLVSNENILKDSMQKADQVMADAQRRAIPRVDEVLVAPTTVATQLYDLVAEERAIGDSIFILARAMDKGRIGIDVFLKNTRSLAREQFLKKALIKSIANGMGLEDGY